MTNAKSSQSHSLMTTEICDTTVTKMSFDRVQFTQLVPHPPHSPNHRNRIGEVERSAYLPGDTRGHSPRLSIGEAEPSAYLPGDTRGHSPRLSIVNLPGHLGL